MADISLTPAARAIGGLSDAIRFGRSVEHPGLADVVDRAGYAIADLRDILTPMLHDLARRIARGEAPMSAGAASLLSYEQTLATVRAAQRPLAAVRSDPGSSR
jgi:hypothetical protein